MKLKPMRDNVIIKRILEKETTESGLIITDVAKKPTNAAIVVAAGPGIMQDGHLIPMSVTPGDKVYFGKYMGTPVSFEGEDYLIIPERELFGVEDQCV